MNRTAVRAFVLLAAAVLCEGAPAKVEVVLGPNASAVERFAGSELCGYLNKLFGVDARTTTRPTAGQTPAFLLGTSASNPRIADFPKVSDQGIVLKRVRGQAPSMIVGGGSPAAVLWAVYELAERWGVRYLIDRDALPARREFRMPSFDAVMEPVFRVRAHPTIQDFAASGEAWGIRDFRPLIAQLAKMKFNRLNIYTYAWQPYLDYQARGIRRSSAWLWYNFHYPITPDMPGRSIFGNAREFWNPDIPLGGNYAEMTRAGIGLAQGLIDFAHQHGMECVLTAPISEYPKEFAPVLGKAATIHMINQLTVAPGPGTPLDDPGLHDLSSAVVRATIDTYPSADRITISINEWRQWIDQYENAWNALDKKYGIGKITTLAKVLDASQHRGGYSWGPEYRGSLGKKAADEVKGDLASLYFFDWLIRGSGAVRGSRRPDMKFLYWGFAEELFPILRRVLPPDSELGVMPDNFPDHLLQRREVLSRLSGSSIKPIIDLTVDDDNMGIIPQMTTDALHTIVGDLRKTHWEGFVARERNPGDHDTSLAYLARAAWDPAADPDRVASEQLQAACGERCGKALLASVHSVEAATHVWERDEEHFAFPVPRLVMKFWIPGPVPAYLLENKKNYTAARDAARSALSAATPEGRAYAAFWSGRMQFAVEYISAIEFVHRAADAEASHRTAQALDFAESALKTLARSIQTYAGVVRTQTDRGAIAVAVEYGYRPLEQKVAELRKQVGSSEKVGLVRR